MQIRALPLIPVIAATAWISPAQAQVTPIAERFRTPQILRTGGFLVLPSISVAESYNSNLYATAKNAKADTLTTAQPRLAARSNWNRHALNFLAGAQINRYARHTSENTTNALIAADGRLDLPQRTAVGGGFALARDTEDRGDPNSPNNAKHPTRYTTATAKLGAARNLGRFNARLDTTARRFRYSNDVTTAGAPLLNSARNRTEYTQAARLGYSAAKGRELYLKGLFDNRVYASKSATRSSRGQTALAGLALDLTGKTRADISVGTTTRHYTRGGKITRPVYGLDLTHNLTRRTSLLAHVARTIEETNLTASTGTVQTLYGLELQHALTQRWLAQTSVGYGNYRYQGLPATRRDQTLTARLGTQYQLTRFLTAGASVARTKRNSTATGAGYTRDLALLTLTGTF